MMRVDAVVVFKWWWSVEEDELEGDVVCSGECGGVAKSQPSAAKSEPRGDVCATSRVDDLRRCERKRGSGVEASERKW
jgi:hypothetical protein